MLVSKATEKACLGKPKDKTKQTNKKECVGFRGTSKGHEQVPAWADAVHTDAKHSPEFIQVITKTNTHTHIHLFRNMDAGTHLHTDTAIYKMTFSLVSWLVSAISALLEVETAGSGIHRSLLGIILWRLP